MPGPIGITAAIIGVIAGIVTVIGAALGLGEGVKAIDCDLVGQVIQCTVDKHGNGGGIMALVGGGVGIIAASLTAF